METQSPLQDIPAKKQSRGLASVSNLKQHATLSSLEELSFHIHTPLLSIPTGLMHTIIKSVPSVGFKEGSIQVRKIYSPDIHLELLNLRLSCIPIEGIHPQDMDDFCSNYHILIRKTNTTNPPTTVCVTTEDFEVRHNSALEAETEDQTKEVEEAGNVTIQGNDATTVTRKARTTVEKVPEKYSSARLFPPNVLSGGYILFTKLAGKNSPLESPQEIDFVVHPQICCGADSYVHKPVYKCFHRVIEDKEMAKKHLEEFTAKMAEVYTASTPETIQPMNAEKVFEDEDKLKIANFKFSNVRNCCVPNVREFIVATKGGVSNSDVVQIATSMLTQQFLELAESVLQDKTGGVTLMSSTRTMQNAFEFHLPVSLTLGNVLRDMLSVKYFIGSLGMPAEKAALQQARMRMEEQKGSSEEQHEQYANTVGETNPLCFLAFLHAHPDDKKGVLHLAFLYPIQKSYWYLVRELVASACKDAAAHFENIGKSVKSSRI